MAARIGGSVLVTGSNRGIGLELVRQLAESTSAPAQIFAACRDLYGAQALKELAQRHPQLLTILRLDVADPVSISKASRVVGDKLIDGSLNLIINNAAINGTAMNNGNNHPGTLAVTGKKEMVDLFVTNAVGPMLIAKEFRSYLQKAADQSGPVTTGMSCSRAAIINISTLLSSVEKCPETFSMAPMYPYRASKAALNMLTCCLAEDFQRDGILVMAIHPGWVKTDMGGPHAPVKTEDSAKGILHVMSTLTEKHNGSLLDWEGNGIPW
ncbi:C-factor [Salvelinus fontinalis]|uniref:C-factor n=1 Tax=Salvelinus fontinalis TaxID=8038 RepID=UPI0024868A81|nr:C-factor [Salvelinus fontinalis]